MTKSQGLLLKQMFISPSNEVDLLATKHLWRIEIYGKCGDNEFHGAVLLARVRCNYKDFETSVDAILCEIFAIGIGRKV